MNRVKEKMEVKEIAALECSAKKMIHPSQGIVLTFPQNDSE